ncbi:hypothetical protein [Halorussus ruber]|uniref:hypothetical protein n=1 Tax=Halorussus ruber TaxID=1126238 RepID=UPI001091FBA8|nr:hypothetical protein [Halorussus ruber]
MNVDRRDVLSAVIAMSLGGGCLQINSPSGTVDVLLVNGQSESQNVTLEFITRDGKTVTKSTYTAPAEDSRVIENVVEENDYRVEVRTGGGSSRDMRYSTGDCAGGRVVVTIDTNPVLTLGMDPCEVTTNTATTETPTSDGG